MPSPEPHVPPRTRRAVRAALAAGVLVVIAALTVPEPPPAVPEGAGKVPFAWDRGDLWSALEQRFRAGRARGCDALGNDVDAAFASLETALAALLAEPPGPEDERLGAVESELFALAPWVAACPRRAADFVALYGGLREAVKGASLGWDLDRRPARDALYRLLYGGRAAVEEVLLQMPTGTAGRLVSGTDEPSAAPSLDVAGVRVHSGDLLVSRGGAPTSALIARGSDYPGNFSHVALLHVDAASGEPTVVEAHIEAGVVLTSADEYLRDTKLRIMVLRLRSDLPELVADPMLPHEVASAAVAAARRRHIPYDFAMNTQDPSAQFCSEVASASYRDAGIELWEGLTSMSSGGVTRWLSSLGVRYFTTHGPSDLELDPKLRVVAEWRDPETLFQDHVDNAVIDALLESAEKGEDLHATWYLLPMARLAKAYSAGSNLVGRTGPVPEGMSASVALRVQWLEKRHAVVKERTLALADEFAARNGYRAPYWELVELARAAVKSERSSPQSPG